jgi:hypothetical protein
VRVGIVTAISALGLFLITWSAPLTLVIIAVGVLGLLVVARSLSAGRRLAAERAMADDLAVLNTVVGTRVIDAAAPPPRALAGITPREQARRAFHLRRPAIAYLFADRIVIRPLPGRIRAEAETIPIKDVSAAAWTTAVTGSRLAPQLRLTMTDRPDITVVFDVAGQRRQLAQFRDTLTRVLPMPVTGQAFPPEQNHLNPALIAAIAAGALLGAGAIPLTAMMTRGSG